MSGSTHAVASAARQPAPAARSASEARARRQSEPFPEQTFLGLQQAVGNRALRDLLNAGLLHPKLRVGAPDDPAEREADRMAAKVTAMPEPRDGAPLPPAHPVPPDIAQCRCAECEEEEEEKEGTVRPKALAGAPPGDGSQAEAGITSLRGCGQPLSPALRSFFEPRFGEDLSGVRVYTGAAAAEAAHSIGARAFTLGRDVVFGAGEYAPASRSGRLLLAHELAHVVQQTLAVTRRSPLVRRQPESAAETETEPPAAEPAAETTPSPAAAEPSPENAAREGTAARGLIVEDGTPEVGPERMTKSAFLAELRPAVCAAAEEGLAGTEHSVRGCPRIALYMRYYEGLSAARIESDLLRFAPETAGAASARDYIPPVAERVRESVRTWAETGEVTGVPEGVPRGLLGMGLIGAIGGALAGIGSLLFKAKSGGARADASPQAVLAQLGAGQPLAGSVRSRMESAFGQRFSGVRVHADARAARLSNRLNARAFAVGDHIAFSRGEYRPGTLVGDALLAHELAHVTQQRAASAPAVNPGSGTAALERDADRSALGAVASVWLGAEATGAGTVANAAPRLRSGLSLQRCGKKKTTTAAVQKPAAEPACIELPAKPEEVKKPEAAVGVLEKMDKSLEACIKRVQESLKKAAAPSALTGQRERLHKMLHQKMIGSALATARSVYERNLEAAPANDPIRLRLRKAYLAVLQKIRGAANTALEVAQGLTPQVRESEEPLYAQNAAAWIEASPMTSAGLAGTTKFEAGDVESAKQYEAELEKYLDDLLQRLPKLKLTAKDKDEIHNRILIALRRAFVTVAAGPSGKVDVRAITNPAIADKYLQVTAYLTAGTSAGPQMSLITTALPAYPLPDPVPEQKLPPAGTSIGRIDLSRVPKDELLSVQFAIARAGGPLPGGSTIQFRNAYWPLTLPVRRAPGQSIEKVRYEFVFDDQSNLRVERLGTAPAEAAAPEFSQLGKEEKKASLVKEFGLSGVDDRPAAKAKPATGKQPAVAERPAAEWTEAELDQVKAAFDLIPPDDRKALRGFALIRDHSAPPPNVPNKEAIPAELILGGYAHREAEPTYDEPMPPQHPPPHIHYYDFLFEAGARGAVGPPGAAGPGSHFSLLHEVGHAAIAQPRIAADKAIAAASQRLSKPPPALKKRRSFKSKEQADALDGWLKAQEAANKAIVAFNHSLSSDPPTSEDEQTKLLKAAKEKVEARDKVRPQLAVLKLPDVVQAAEELDAANDALLLASEQLMAAKGQIPIFGTLARRFKFHAFTDYARRGGDSEWFAETYALYRTDPQRLLQMNRSVYFWFRAGMPMDPNWNPPPAGGP